jgi:biopolymer transport protein ExbD
VSQIGTLVQTLAKGGPVMIPLLACSIARDGVVYLEREPIGPAQLTARLQARGRTEPDLAVVIEAETEVRHGRVVDVMDAV